MIRVQFTLFDKEDRYKPVSTIIHEGRKGLQRELQGTSKESNHQYLCQKILGHRRPKKIRIHKNKI